MCQRRVEFADTVTARDETLLRLSLRTVIKNFKSSSEEHLNGKKWTRFSADDAGALVKKKIKFSSYRGNQNVSKSYMTNGLIIYDKLFAHFLIY